MSLDQGRATIFVRGPHWAFIYVSRAKFKSNILLQSSKWSLRGPDVARGPYVAPSWSRLTFMKIHKNIFMSIYKIDPRVNYTDIFMSSFFVHKCFSKLECLQFGFVFFFFGEKNTTLQKPLMKFLWNWLQDYLSFLY